MAGALVAYSGCFGQPEKVPANKVNDAILVFADLVDSASLQKFGVKSKADLKALKPGKQFKTYFIGLAELKKYQTGHDAEDIIKEYPSTEVALVDQKGRIITSIEFENKNHTWVATGYGSTPEFAVLIRAQDSIPKTAINKGRMIRVPSLHMCFMSLPNHGATDFLMLESYKQISYKRGETVKSAKVMEVLMPLANKAANPNNTN